MDFSDISEGLLDLLRTVKAVQLWLNQQDIFVDHSFAVEVSVVMTADGKQASPCSFTLGLGCCYLTQFNPIMRQRPVGPSQDTMHQQQRWNQPDNGIQCPTHSHFDTGGLGQGQTVSGKSGLWKSYENRCLYAASCLPRWSVYCGVDKTAVAVVTSSHSVGLHLRTQTNKRANNLCSRLAKINEDFFFFR